MALERKMQRHRGIFKSVLSVTYIHVVCPCAMTRLTKGSEPDSRSHHDSTVYWKVSETHLPLRNCRKCVPKQTLLMCFPGTDAKIIENDESGSRDVKTLSCNKKKGCEWPSERYFFFPSSDCEVLETRYLDLRRRRADTWQTWTARFRWTWWSCRAYQSVVQQALQVSLDGMKGRCKSRPVGFNAHSMFLMWRRWLLWL